MEDPEPTGEVGKVGRKDEVTEADHQRRRVRRRVLVEILAVPVVAVTLLWVMQDRFVFLPVAGLPPIATVLPTGTDVTYPTADGIGQHGWWVPATEGRADDPGSRVTVIAFHGNAANRAGLAGYARALAAAGFQVLLPEYRGYADVAGSPSEEGLVADAEAALAYARSRPDVDPDRIVYVGHSLGTGVAAALAERQSPRALVLLAPFTSLPAVAWDRLPGLPYDLLMRTRFRTGDRIGKLRVPILIVGGTADTTLPGEHSRVLFELATGPKRLVMIDGADHDLVPPGQQGPTLAELTTGWIHDWVGD